MSYSDDEINTEEEFGEDDNIDLNDDVLEDPVEEDLLGEDEEEDDDLLTDEFNINDDEY